MEVQKARSLLVWGIADLYFILSVTVAILSGILLPSIQKEMGLSTSELGLLGFSFFLTFGAMQFVAGRLIDSQGPRATLAVSGLMSAGGFFLLSYADSFIWAVIGQMITGVGFSTAYVAAIYLAQKWFSEQQFPFMSGVTQMSANIVSALVLFVMAVTGIILVDFRTITMRLGFISLILAILMFIIVRSETGGEKGKSLCGADLRGLFQIPQFWFGVLYFSTNFGAFLTFSSLWNIPDSLAYGHSLKTATVMSATLRFGGAFGAVASGLLAKRLSRCSTVAKWYSCGALCLAGLLIYGPVFPVPLTFIIMALLGFFCGGTALGFPLVAQHIPASLKGAGFGLMTTLGYLLCAFLEYLVGAVLSSTHSGSVDAFKIALTPLILVLGIGWICSLKLQETKP